LAQLRRILQPFVEGPYEAPIIPRHNVPERLG
jgi:hypothetical protein